MKVSSVIFEAQLRRFGALLANDIPSSRRTQDMLGTLGAKVLSGRVCFEPCVRTPYESDWAVPESFADDKVILYLHGGGYCAGSLEYARGFGGLLAELVHRKTLCVGYRLAPEHPYPAAIDDVVAAYRMILESYEPDRIAVVGESAGGGLCFALALRIKAEGLPQPGRIVAISPWTDLTLTQESYVRNRDVDPILKYEVLAGYAEYYAPHDLRTPFVSPLFGDLEGLPPCLIFAGTHELLEDDSRMMAKQLAEAGVPCELHIEEGAWHVYIVYGVYEARVALRRIKAFLEDE